MRKEIYFFLLGEAFILFSLSLPPAAHCTE